MRKFIDIMDDVRRPSPPDDYVSDSQINSVIQQVEDDFSPESFLEEMGDDFGFNDPESYEWTVLKSEILSSLAYYIKKQTDDILFYEHNLDETPDNNLRGVAEGMYPDVANLMIKRGWSIK